MKTLSLRIRGVKTELEEAGLETEGMAETTSQLQAKLKALTHGEVDIMLDANTFKSTTAILREMADAWEHMTDVERAAALELIGGKRQANILSSLITNFDIVEDVIATSTDSAGSAIAENEKWLDSIEGKTYEFTNALETMWNNLIDPEKVKAILDFGTKLVQFLDSTPGKITAIIAAAAGLAKVKGFSLAGLGQDTMKSLGNIKTAYAALQNLASNPATQIGKGFDPKNIQLYANAVSDLTAKQQANMLASVGLNKQQIQLALQYNGLSDDVIREATAHTFAKNAKQQEQMTDAQLLQTKILYSAATLKATGDTNALAAAEFLEANASKLAAGADLEQLLASELLDDSTKDLIRALWAKVAADNAGTVSAKGLKAAWDGLKASMGPIGWIMLAISLLTTVAMAISKVTKSVEELNQEVSQLMSEYESKQSELKSQKETIDELAKSYQELSGGVNTLNNENIGLTVESYDEYLDTVNKIADMFPELISGYDAEGNAILSLKGKVESLTDAYKAKQEAANAQLLTPKNQKSIWEAYEKSIVKDGFKFFKGKQSSLGDDKAVLEALSRASNEQLIQLDRAASTLGTADIVKMNDILRELGADISWDKNQYASFVEDYGLSFQNVELGTVKNPIDNIQAYRQQVKASLSQVNSDVETAFSSIRSTVAAGLMFNDVYQQLDETRKSLVDTLIGNIDQDMIDSLGADSVESLTAALVKNIEQIDSDLVNSVFDVQDSLGEAIVSGNEDAFNIAKVQLDSIIQDQDWIRDESGQVLIDSNTDVFTRYLQQLARDMEEQSKNFEVKLKFQMDFETKSSVGEIVTDRVGEIGNEARMAIREAVINLGMDEEASIDTIYGRISSNLADENGSKIRADKLDSMYSKFLEGDTEDWTKEQFASMKALHAITLMYGTDLDTVKSQLIELGFVLPALDDIGSFNLASESTNKSIDDFQSNIDSLKDAWNSLNSKEMTKSEFIDLAQEFPDLMNGVNLADDNWMVKAKENIEALNATKIENFIANLEEMKLAMQDRGEDTSALDSMLAYAREIQNQPLLDPEETIEQSDTLTGLTEACENYRTILEQTNEILYDGQTVSEDYYESLKEYIDDVDELNECFDENNKQIVTNVAKLKQLIAQHKKATTYTIRTAKAQAQLQYNELSKELGKHITAMQYENMAYGFVTDATLDNISAMSDQLEILKETIQQYGLLEIGLSDAAKAYSDWEKAQERDAQLSYDESFVEMLQSIDDGIINNRMGTEEFEYAVKALMDPESLKTLQALTDPNERAKFIHDYFDGGSIAEYYTVDEESGDKSITVDNARAFQSRLEEAGLVEGGPEGWSWTEAATDLETVAAILGDSEATVLAMLSASEDFDILWGDMLTDLTLAPFDREVKSLTEDMEELNKQFMAGEIDTDEYNTRKGALEERERRLTAEAKESVLGSNGGTPDDISDDTRGYYDAYKDSEQVIKDVAIATQNLTLAQLEYEEAKRRGASTKELARYEQAVVHAQGELDAANTRATELEKELNEIGKPTELEIQFVLSDIEKQIEILGPKFQQAVEENFELDENGYYVIKPGLTALQLEADWPGIQYYVDLLNQQTTLKAWMETDPAEEQANKLKEAVDTVIEQIEQNLITLELDDEAVKNIVEQANKILSGIIQSWNLDVVLPEWMLKVGDYLGLGNLIRGAESESGASGEANAYGTARSLGGDLVGELGREMVVDPRAGRYYTVGNNGAEMVDLPKDAIVFNHRQTEELLRNGHTSRGKFASGTALVTGNAFADYAFPSYSPMQDVATSLKNGTEISNILNDAISNFGDLSDSFDNAADSVGEFEETMDWIAIRMEEYDERISKLSAELENQATYLQKNSKINDIIIENQKKYADSVAGAIYYENYAQKYLEGMSDTLVEAAKNGAIAITEFTKEQDEATVNAIQNYRDYAQKAADLYRQAEEIITEIRNLVIQQIDNAYETGSVKATVEASQTEKLQNAVDLAETSGLIPAGEYYAAMMENAERTIAYLTPARDEMQAIFDQAVRNGTLEVGSDAWYTELDKLYQIDAEIDSAIIQIEEFQNAINDLYWDNFDQLINRLDYIKNDTQNLIDLVGHADMVVDPDLEDGWAADQVEWTKEGLATMGLYAQQMEIAEYQAQQYAEAIEKLTADYKAGLYSENEYLEKLNELKDGQYDCIESYYDARDAIKDLQEQRVDSIKRGIEAEITALEKLIDKRKEQISVEQDLYNFQKQTAEKTKSISEIERKLAALSTDNSASAVAKKKQLEADLAEAKAELEDHYYNRSIENQQTALDKEAEAFREQKEAEIEAWDKYLENIEILVADSLGIVQANATEIGATLTAKAEEYNLAVSEAVLSPWENGTLAIDEYTVAFGDSMSSTIAQLDTVKNQWTEIWAELRKANEEAAKYNNIVKETIANNSVANKHAENAAYVAATKTPEPTTQAAQNTSQAQSQTQQQSITVGGKINAGNAKIYSYAGGQGYSQYFSSDPIYTVLEDLGEFLKVRWHKANSGITGFFKKSDVKGYAKGSKGLEKDQWAILDELGEELQLVPDGNGRLAYMKKGTGILTNTLTERIMDLAMNPQEVLDRNRPAITAPHVVNNEINLNLTYGDMVSIGEFHGDNLADLEKMVAKQFEKHTKDINSALKRFVR